jgi:hypothetical protein
MFSRTWVYDPVPESKKVCSAASDTLQHPMIVDNLPKDDIGFADIAQF